jgi:hypothetical protein
LEQKKARKGIRTQSTKATAWLVGYLSGKDEVPSAQIKKDGKAAADLSPDSINRARQKLGPERIEVAPPGCPPQPPGKLLEENLQ